MITLKPLKFIDINHFSVVERLDVIQGNSGAHYVQLFDDSQRYIPPAGSTLQIVFPRTMTIAATPANQDVTVPLTLASVSDGSVYSFNLSAAQTDVIISEGVKLLITQGASTKTYPVDHLVRRRSSAPGA